MKEVPHKKRLYGVKESPFITKTLPFILRCTSGAV